MIDNFGLVLTHGLLALVAWRLLLRADLDDDRAAPLQGSGSSHAPAKDEADA